MQEAAAVSFLDAKTVSLREKIAYGLGLTGLNLVLTIFSTYILYFYTDVAVLPSSSIATMFLVSRLLSCVAYVGLGVVIDKTQSRWGKSRPYFLWCAGPLAIATVLVVLTPNFGEAGKLVYAYVTYNLLLMILNVVSLALGTIVPSMTESLQERSALGSIGAFFGIAGLLAVSYCTLPLVNFFGAGNQATGFRLTLGLYASLAFIFFLYTFWFIRERVTPARQGSVPIREGLLSVVHNYPWLSLMMSLICFWVMVIMHTQTTVYYLQCNVMRPDLVPLVMSTLVAALPGSICAFPISRRLGKRNAMLVGCFAACLGLVLIILGGPKSVPMLLTGNAVFAFGKGIVIALFIAMIPDAVDYGEWRTTVWAPGIIYGGMSVAINVGMGIGSAVSAWLFSRGNYLPHSIQTADSLRAIEWSYLWVPLIAVMAMIGVLAFYRLDFRITKIKADLHQRRIDKKQRETANSNYPAKAYG